MITRWWRKERSPSSGGWNQHIQEKLGQGDDDEFMVDRTRSGSPVGQPNLKTANVGPAVDVKSTQSCKIGPPRFSTSNTQICWDPLKITDH